MSLFIGQGRPLAAMNWQNGSVAVLEALTRCIPPEQIDRVLLKTDRVERRVRKLPAGSVVWFMVMMGLRADLDLSGLWRQVVGVLANVYAVLAGAAAVSKSALCKARGRLGARPMRQLMLKSGRALPATKGATYKGMRLRAMDGDDCKVPDTPANAAAFGRPSTARDGRKLEGGYPQFHLTRLIDVGTRLTMEALIRPNNTLDHDTARFFLPHCHKRDLLLWDCGFYSFDLIRRTVLDGIHFLSPVPSHAVFKPIRHLSDGSYLTKIYPHPNDRRDDRNGQVVRIIEYTLDEPARQGHGERHRLITDLLDEQQYPAKELIVLYHQRWEIEIANDEVTTHLLNRAVELRSQKPAGVVQEMYAVLLAHNAVRLVMAEAAQSVDVDPRTLSFMNAVRVVRETVQEMRSAPARRLPLLYQAMLIQIAQGVLPERDGRINPRVVKVIRPSNFPVKQEKHKNWPQPKQAFIESVVMLK